MSDEERMALIEGFVKAMTPMLTNETHAWNVWNYMASDRGAIREALQWAWGKMSKEPGEPNTSEYTPTTEEVRRSLGTMQYAEFDRWLEQELRTAWEAGWDNRRAEFYNTTGY